jgi:hypothetical protein
MAENKFERILRLNQEILKQICENPKNLEQRNRKILLQLKQLLALQIGGH